jgi:hypothetical protein
MPAQKEQTDAVALEFMLCLQGRAGGELRQRDVAVVGKTGVPQSLVKRVPPLEEFRFESVKRIVVAEPYQVRAAGSVVELVPDFTTAYRSPSTGDECRKILDHALLVEVAGIFANRPALD